MVQGRGDPAVPAIGTVDTVKRPDDLTG